MTLPMLFIQQEFSALTVANFPQVTKETKLSAIQQCSMFCRSYCMCHLQLQRVYSNSLFYPRLNLTAEPVYKQRRAKAWALTPGVCSTLSHAENVSGRETENKNDRDDRF